MTVNLIHGIINLFLLDEKYKTTLIISKFVELLM